MNFWRKIRSIQLPQSASDAWSPRPVFTFPHDSPSQNNALSQLSAFPLLKSTDLTRLKSPPTKVRILFRDFVHDSLYNPNYGYFSRRATIFNTLPFNFKQIKSDAHFFDLLQQAYVDFERNLDDELPQPDPTRQLWHTPSELFRPHYAFALARFIVTQYILSYYPYEDLKIFEIGAGTGSLACDILSFIRYSYPEVYSRTHYTIIEISTSLAQRQHHALINASHHSHFEIINQSVLDWSKSSLHSPCYFLACEVFDNLSHDQLRYQPETFIPLQSYVFIDEKGQFHEYFQADLDPLLSRFLAYRDRVPSALIPRPSRPFFGNLTHPEYVPTNLFRLFNTLNTSFPRHTLIATDFHALPTLLPGLNAPVVQTRYNHRTIPVSTPLVKPGYFDYFFPTNFGLMSHIYRLVTGKFTRVYTHEEFLCEWADVNETQTRNGENPMLSWYSNASVITTI